VEAARRLRASFGNRIALAAVLPGPGLISAHGLSAGAGAADVVLALGKEFLAAGADVLLVQDETEAPGMSLATLANVARFHQAAALSHAVARYGLPPTVPVALHAPVSVRGVAVTPGPLPRDTDISVRPRRATVTPRYRLSVRAARRCPRIPLHGSHLTSTRTRSSIRRRRTRDRNDAAGQPGPSRTAMSTCVADTSSSRRPSRSDAGTSARSSYSPAPPTERGVECHGPAAMLMRPL
jgi:hypothetical protein